ncbi:hypothetical protein NKI88_02425 [Mesorhizobium sp. M0317]|uniref:hypothetical protein n=1 Tax=Mesorhizobium sp. M0317 TaxID=2956935 RepID=UPI003334BC32
MTKLAHPHPEAHALADCMARGRCLCHDDAQREQRQRWRLIDRGRCEAKYRRAVAQILDKHFPGDRS